MGPQRGREGCITPAALTTDVCVGRQAVADQLHVPSGGIHAALWGAAPRLACEVSKVRS